jgi:hypothetical protein
MSLDEAVMVLSDVFEFGQGYVALSRVRRLSGLHLLGWNERAFQVHPAVLLIDDSFHLNSQAAEQAFAELSESDLTQMFDNFIKACGGKYPVAAKGRHRASSGGKPGPNLAYAERLAKLREKYPNAYRPWTAEQIKALAAEFPQEPKIKTLAKRFGRQPGSIKARLIKLGLLTEDGEPVLN